MAAARVEDRETVRAWRLEGVIDEVSNAAAGAGHDTDSPAGAIGRPHRRVSHVNCPPARIVTGSHPSGGHPDAQPVIDGRLTNCDRVRMMAQVDDQRAAPGGEPFDRSVGLGYLRPRTRAAKIVRDQHRQHPFATIGDKPKRELEIALERRQCEIPCADIVDSDIQAANLVASARTGTGLLKSRDLALDDVPGPRTVGRISGVRESQTPRHPQRPRLERDAPLQLAPAVGDRVAEGEHSEGAVAFGRHQGIIAPVATDPLTALTAGGDDLARAAADLAERLPVALAPLARLAYNYRWSWLPTGPDLFRRLEPDRFERCQQNPVRLLQEVPARVLRQAASDQVLLDWAHKIEASVKAELDREPETSVLEPERPVAFLCAEFGVHVSLPVYSGGLGVLAGDLLKEASDRAVPFVAVGLMYRKGYFRQRIDASGWQHEYWLDTDPERLPAALVTGADARPLTIQVPIYDRDVNAQIWRIDVGRVPLFLLDADLPENGPLERWITARLYEADEHTRLAQYVLLGIGGIRALRALGIEPGVVHLNEGHAALAPLSAGNGARPERQAHRHPTRSSAVGVVLPVLSGQSPR